MFNTLSKLFSTLFDDTFAPPEALAPLQPIAVDDGMPAVEWHNGFGTLNDFEVPASSCMSDPFDSFNNS